MLIVDFPETACAGGVFTASATRSADVDWCRHALATHGGRAAALIVNSGNSNAFTGSEGRAKNDATLDAVSALAACGREEIFLGATGVIGEPVRPNLIADALPDLWPRLGPPDWNRAARAIMTTDTWPKGGWARLDIAGRSVNIVGIAKGSGMIAPNMATMLAYIFTDAGLSAASCQALIARHVATSFNSISVDGDCSTSDSLMLFSTGKEHYDTADHPDLVRFSEALSLLMQDLAQQIIRDGEGASHFIEISVSGAPCDLSARKIAASIANSPLVKTAVGAGDANWGRIIMAAGNAGVALERDRLVLHIGEAEIACNGGRSPRWSEEAATAAMREDPVRIRLDTGTGGTGNARFWTCDLTSAYIDINGAYRS